MTRFHVIPEHGVDFEVIGDDDADVLGRAVDADVLRDGDEGAIEQLPDPDVEPFEPEGPG